MPTAERSVATAPRPADDRVAQRRRFIWAVVLTGVAQFMAGLDNLVVTTALPVIRVHLHAGLSGLEWTVNAYTLTFAVLLLTGAALGDRFGRRRMLMAGLAMFTFASAAAALAPSIGALVAARAVQGAGGALLVPLSLTALSASVPAARRNLALGIWGAIGGLAVAIGPLVGGAVVEGISWQFIFWLNVPIGLMLLPLVRLRLGESRGVRARLDVRGVLLASLGLLGIVFGLVRGGEAGWTSAEVLTGFTGGGALFVAFLLAERRTAVPMLPLRLFRNRQFSIVNVVALLMSFGMFGAIFLLAQFFQTVQHYSPLSSGLRILPWSGMPVLVAPVAALLLNRVGGRVLVATGLALQAAGLGWIAAVTTASTPYSDFVGPFVLCGVGMSLFFVPVASLVLAAVGPSEEGIASGTNNAVRELGGVFGVSVLAAIFAASGSYASGASFVSGLVPAVAAGAVVVAVGAIAAAFLPRARMGAARSQGAVPAIAALEVA